MATSRRRSPTLRKIIADGLRRCDDAATTAQQGGALEDLLEAMFYRLPGVDEVKRNTLNAFATEELDLAVGNLRHRNGLRHLADVILVECKNWSSAVGTEEVVYFIARVKQRGCQCGILVAMQGVTGDPTILTAARFAIASALAEKIRIIVITRFDLEEIRTVADFVILIRKKVLELVASGTTI